MHGAKFGVQALVLSQSEFKFSQHATTYFFDKGVVNVEDLSQSDTRWEL